MDDTPPRKPSLGSRLATALRPKQSGRRLMKKSTVNLREAAVSKDSPLKKDSLSTSSTRTNNQAQNEFSPNVDIQTGERQDYTALIHGLGHQGSFDSLKSVSRLDPQRLDPDKRAGDRRVASLSEVLWHRICRHLSPSGVASLAFASKTLLYRLGPEAWIALNHPENEQFKTEFLVSLDSQLPDHLLCFRCITYHRRVQKGQERLRATATMNPLFICPWASEPTQTPLRMRLTPGHTLPFTFVQLVMRAHRYGPEYGIPPESLSRRWRTRESEWSHQSRYYIDKGHLLLRIVSKSFAEPCLPPSGLRHLLYSREDYFPYFSACAHWRDGELMNNCKCALGHIPKPKETIAQQLRTGPQINNAIRHVNAIVSLCGKCRPMRRCPDCPTEYLIEIRFEEDKNDPVNKFKQSIVVTRWSDLGDGTTPLSGEWFACDRETDYDSFATIGRRGISGIFEAQSGVAIPGQRMLSLNPENTKLGEKGHNWY
ncbi:hypothetical protein LSUB1_G005257 [Lachnellula subtilissima]|uniref:Uncharacterized protein n=1 Tax=Lachnellula subtilissima TaxID=602034 RepID=A0A8H8RRX0_9HELO|nr:hypothetical protein LSUB1_G005257 [Lachnellula subtilissima]